MVLGLWAGMAVAAGQGVVAESVRDIPRVEAGGQGRAVVTVTAQPRRVRGEPARFVIGVRLEALRFGEQRWRMRVSAVVFASGDEEVVERWRRVVPGDRLEVAGHVSGFGRGGDLTAVALSTWSSPEAVGEPAWWVGWVSRVREALRRSCEVLPAAEAGLVPGLVVGDDSGLPSSVAEDFEATGLTHLVAVSGANVSIVVGAVLWLAVWCGAGLRWRVSSGAVALVGFAVLAGPEPSVLRASVMGGVGLFAMGFGRRSAAMPAVSAAVVGLLLYDPQLAWRLGFALSVAATVGLVWWVAPWVRRWRDRGRPAWAAGAVAVPLAAQLAVTPLLVAVDGRVSVVAVPANVVAAPAVPVATVVGLLCCGVAWWWPGAGEVAAWVAGWPARWLVGVAEVGAAVPMGSLPWPDGLVGAVSALVVLAVGAWVVRRWRGVGVAVCVAALLVAVVVVPGRLTGAWPPPRWVLVMCDVGQGDAVVLSTGVPGSAVVVDAGPEPERVDRCLSELGVESVPLLVVTHFHADHVGGVAGVFRGRRVGHVLVPGEAAPEEGRRRLVEAAGTGGFTSVVGHGWRLGRVRLEVLAAGDRFSGTGADANNDSVVLRATVAGVRVLLTGDIELEAQRWLTESGADVSAEVLKVPHHGSGRFLPEFVSAVGPAVGLISVGEGNDYGHPHPGVVSRLVECGASVWRTDLHGDVAVVEVSGGVGVYARG
ncbi:ComEC/Rec2 family competence protein [Stackebrandtia albiflava]